MTNGSGAGPTSRGLALVDWPVPAAEFAQVGHTITGKCGRMQRLVDDMLGLPLARGPITRLGGTIEAGSAPEGGAAVTVRLPPAPAGWSA